MASVAMQAASLSSAVSKSSFLGNGQSRLARVSQIAPAPRTLVLKVEAKGEWLPGLASPAYLDGSLAGDNGFDPLALGEDPENLKWYVQAELQNGRWAMLGVAGIIIPEALGAAGITTAPGVIDVPVWFNVQTSEYWASASTLFVIEFLLFHFVEVRRWQDIKNPGSVSEDPIHKGSKLPAGEVGYPGGIFNPLGFPTDMASKEKELANARTAMVAFFGIIVQSHITGTGPFANLLAHLSDPWHNTVFQSLDSFFKA